MMEIFRIENLTKQFTKDYVLNDFSFTVEKGEKVSISGPSGIGKTTFFKLMLGFEKPDKGSIYFKGEKITDENIWKIRKQIAYVPQNLSMGTGKVTTLFDETMNYRANVFLKKERKNSLPDLFKTFQLSDETFSKNLEELSGGERQRIAIINALLLERNIFFLDEITSALDQDLKIEVLDYFLKNDDFTVLYISHDAYFPSDIQLRTIKLNENGKSC